MRTPADLARVERPHKALCPIECSDVECPHRALQLVKVRRVSLSLSELELCHSPRPAELAHAEESGRTPYWLY